MPDLRANTATTVTVGQLVDNADGVTPETGLAVGTVDEIGAYKHEATAITDLSGTTTFTHRAGGIYTMTLAAGDVDTVGRLDVVIRDDSVCLPYCKTFNVLNEESYDEKYGKPSRVYGEVSNAVGTPTPGVFWSDTLASDDGGGDADHFVGRRIRFTGGNLVNQSRPIAASVVDTGEVKLTLAKPFSQAPANDDPFVVEL